MGEYPCMVNRSRRYYHPLMINSPKFDDDITMNGLKSLDTNDKITKEFHQDSQKPR